MTAYYNEIDPFAAAWLRELIKAGHIAHGYVDERSIEDVTPADLEGFTQCHFFAGIGVWSLALRQAGWPDDRPVFTGSCPCTPFSAAGKGKGFDDERHLWPAFHHLIKECRPPIVFGEQVARKAGLTWVQLVQADLEGEDYTCGFVVFPACGLGAPHLRQRLYWVANCQRTGLEGHTGDGNGVDESGRIEEDSNGSTAPGGVSGILDEPDISIEGRVRIRGGSGERDESGACRRDAEPPRSGTSGAVADSPGERHERRGSGETCDEPGEVERPERLRDAGDPGPTNGFWRDADWLFCRDGKWRSAKPGSFVLASRSPNRMGRLRGIGNCIVAPQAKAFIESAITGMSGDVLTRG